EGGADGRGAAGERLQCLAVGQPVDDVGQRLLRRADVQLGPGELLVVQECIRLLRRRGTRECGPGAGDEPQKRGRPGNAGRRGLSHSLLLCASRGTVVAPRGQSHGGRTRAARAGRPRSGGRWMQLSELRGDSCNTRENERATKKCTFAVSGPTPYRSVGAARIRGRAATAPAAATRPRCPRSRPPRAPGGRS